MKTLLLLRHAKSSWKNNALSDYERPLNKRGQNDAPRMGKLLRVQNLVPDLIVASSAERAVATAEAVAQASGYEHELKLSRTLYQGSAESYIDVLNDTDDDCNTALLIGHNPTLEDILEDLTGSWERIPTAGLIQISLPIESWRDLIDDTAGTLVNLWIPRELANKDI